MDHEKPPDKDKQPAWSTILENRLRENGWKRSAWTACEAYPNGKSFK